MSSFYGNIKFNNQTPLIYDKIYSSRYQMEQECHSDGIFNGRYILISYGDIRYTPYHKVEPMNEVDFANAIKAGNIYYITDSQSEDGFKSTTEYKAGQDYYIRTIYSIDEGSIFAKNKSIDEQHYNHDYHSTVWQKIWTSTQDSTEIEEKYIMVSHLNAETPRITMIVDAPNDTMEFDDSNQVFYLVPTNQHALNIPGSISKEDFDRDKGKLFLRSEIPNEKGEYIFDPVPEEAEWDINTIYYICQNIDALPDERLYDQYPNSKPYVDGMISEELYINLTQDRKIPLFVSTEINKYDVATSWDRLTKYYFMRYRETDGRPHFDPIMSTDLEYRFHMPRNWKWDNELDFEYNKEGFFPEKSSNTSTQNNEIILTNKASGDIYPEHRFDEPSAGKYIKIKDNLTIIENNVQTKQQEYEEANRIYLKILQENPDNTTLINSQKEIKDKKFKEWRELEKIKEDLKRQQVNNAYGLVKSEQPDMKRFKFDLRMLGDAVSNMWDRVYPKIQAGDPNSERDVYIGNDRLRPENDQENYPETLAEAVRKLYYWLGLKTDNNFIQGPWIDPKTEEEVDTIFGVLNGASTLLGDFDDTFNDQLFIPVASPYYPDGYNKKIGDIINAEEGTYYTQLSDSEYYLLHNGGAGPLYKKGEGENHYIQVEPDAEKEEQTQYYRNMNSLFALLRTWIECVKDNQADWIVELPKDWEEGDPISPKYIHNKPSVLTVDQENVTEGSINWYWKNYAL